MIRVQPVYVLDAGALIAVLNNEPGAEIVEELYEEAGKRHVVLRMHRLNLLEVYSEAMRTSGREWADEIFAIVKASLIQVDSEISDRMFSAIGRFKLNYKMSLADAVALAYTTRWGASGKLVTADHHELDALEGVELINFHWIR